MQNGENYLKKPGAEDDSEAAQTNEKLHKCVSSTGSTKQLDEAVSEPTALSAVGVIIKDERGIETTIDEIFWDRSPPISTAKFVLLVSWKEPGHTMQLTVQSRFLVSVIMGILPRTTSLDVRKQHDSVSFEEPFSPLYWFYDKIIEVASDTGSLKGDDSRDLDILRGWYERNLLPQHVDIRNTINSGYVSFDLLWALYKPNDTVYTRDNFQQPQLRIVSFADYDGSMNEFTGVRNRPRSFRLTLLRQDWDASVQVFKVVSEKEDIKFYTGSRRIADLAVYPLRHYPEGMQDLLASLEARGRRWKSLVTQPLYMVHKGPAIQLDGTNSRTRRHVSSHSPILTHTWPGTMTEHRISLRNGSLSTSLDMHFTESKLTAAIDQSKLSFQ